MNLGGAEGSNSDYPCKGAALPIELGTPHSLSRAATPLVSAVQRLATRGVIFNSETLQFRTPAGATLTTFRLPPLPSGLRRRRTGPLAGTALVLPPVDFLVRQCSGTRSNASSTPFRSP